MITLIGLGPGDINSLSRSAENALREASARMESGTGKLYLRTVNHPSTAEFTLWPLHFESFDHLYETAADFHNVYHKIAEIVLFEAQKTLHEGAAREISYALPGHPLFAEESVRLILERAALLNIPVKIVSSGSFVDAALTAVRANLTDGCDVRDALTLPTNFNIDDNGNCISTFPDPSRALLLYQIYDTHSASRTKLSLMKIYPDEHEIAVIRWAGVAGKEEVERVPLFRLDRVNVDHLTSVYIPELTSKQRSPNFHSLVGLMERLRAPDGCPWDREQTHETLKRYFIEETYEVIEAIDSGDPEHLCEELGDALLQVVFHAQLAAESGDFDITSVTDKIVTKLIRRHPHVFGTVEVDGSEEVLRNWEMIKKKEKSSDHRKSILDGVPLGLPALMQAMEISTRVAKVGFEWKDFSGVLAKLEEELQELKTELHHPEPDSTKIIAELGDLFFTLVQVARWQKLDPEDALRSMLKRFSNRFRYVEKRAEENDKTLTSMTIEQMDVYWDEAKANGL